jgi:hypothetical protein
MATYYWQPTPNQEGGRKMNKKQLISIVALVLAITCSATLAAAASCVSTTAPPKVTDLFLSIISNTGIVFTFTVPNDPSGITRVELGYYKDGKTTISSLNWAKANHRDLVPTPSITEFPVGWMAASFNKLDLNTKYSFALKFYNSCGLASAPSNIMSFTTTPLATNEVLIGWKKIDATSTYTVGYGALSRFTPGVTNYQYTTVTSALNKKLILPPGNTWFVAVRNDHNGLWSQEIEYTP